MAATVQTGDKGRLEDFIVIAESGITVQIEVKLRRLIAGPEGPPEEADFMADDTEVYLLIGDYTVEGIGEEKQIISKVYILGATAESPVASSRNKDIANQRLKMDYGRLKDAGIKFKEKFF